VTGHLAGVEPGARGKTLQYERRIEMVHFSRGMGWCRNPHFSLQEGTFRGC
jgi:hypothetical protein